MQKKIIVMEFYLKTVLFIKMQCDISVFCSPHTFLHIAKGTKKFRKVKQEAVKVLFSMLCAWKFTTLAVSLHLRSDCINYAVPVSW